MTIAYVSIGSTQLETVTVSPLTVTYPASISAGNLLIMLVQIKYSDVSPTTPSGWTLVTSRTGGQGSAGNDSGSIGLYVYTKIASGSESGTVSITLSGGTLSTAGGTMLQYSKTTGTWDVASTSGVDSTGSSTSFNVTADANPGVISGDMVLVLSSINGNLITAWGSHSLTQTGVTFGSAVERFDDDTTSGTDHVGVISEHPVSSGTGSAAPVYSMSGTGTASSNSPTGPSVFLRLREATGTVALNQTTETDTAQAIAKIKNRAVGQNTETDLAQAIAKIKRLALGQNLETDTAQAIARVKVKAVGLVTETNIAQPIAVGSNETIVDVNQANETDTAQSIATRKNVAVGLVTETDTAQSFTEQKIYPVGQTTETDLSQTITQSKRYSVGLTSESDLAQPIAHIKRVAVGQASETDIALPIAEAGAQVIPVGQVQETDSAQSIRSRKIIVIAQVGETNLAQSLFKSKRVAIVQVVEFDSAFSIFVSGGVLAVPYYIYVVPAESRVYLIPAEDVETLVDRTFAIPTESRISQVPHD